MKGKTCESMDPKTAMQCRRTEGHLGKHATWSRSMLEKVEWVDPKTMPEGGAVHA